VAGLAQQHDAGVREAVEGGGEGLVVDRGEGLGGVAKAGGKSVHLGANTRRGGAFRQSGSAPA
jgi:hypothetical protein